MALDYHVGEPSRREPEAVSIEEDVHLRLVDLATSHEAPSLRRPLYFYEDAVFTPAQIPALLADVDRLLNFAAGDAALLEFLRGLRLLVADALGRGRGVVAWAD